MHLRILEAELTICRLGPREPWPAWIMNAPAGAFLSITRTPDELSIVCSASLVPVAFTETGGRTEPGWRAIGVVGPLAFSMVGVIASLTTPLAEAGISVFVLSTFDTDYVMVKGERLGEAVRALEESGVVFKV